MRSLYNYIVSKVSSKEALELRAEEEGINHQENSSSSSNEEETYFSAAEEELLDDTENEELSSREPMVSDDSENLSILPSNNESVTTCGPKNHVVVNDNKAGSSHGDDVSHRIAAAANTEAVEESATIEPKLPGDATIESPKAEEIEQQNPPVSLENVGKKIPPRRDPGAAPPKRNKSAYLLYKSAVREQIRASNPGMNLDQLAKYTSDRYTKLPPSEREAWEKRAAADKARYDLELASYEPPKTTRKRKKPPRDPRAPKRNRSAYMLYQNAMMEKLKVSNPCMTLGEMSKHSSAMYAEMTSAEKEAWVARANADKARFNHELKSYDPPPGYNDKGSAIVPRHKPKRDANAPKGNASPFVLYQIAMREQFKRENPTMTFERYKKLTPEEMATWEARAADDKKRYDAEIANYVPPPGHDTCGKIVENDPLRKRVRTHKRARNDPLKPKRAKSAYLFFVSEMRPHVMKEFPGIKFLDVGHVIGQRWRALASHERKQYEDMASKDKVRYQTEMEQYKANQAATASPPVPAISQTRVAPHTSQVKEKHAPEETVTSVERAAENKNRDGEDDDTGIANYISPSGHDIAIIENRMEDDQPRPDNYNEKRPRNDDTTAASKPKCASDAFTFFFTEMRPRIMNQSPGIEFVDARRILEQRWTALASHEKKWYQDMESKDEIRYQTEMEQHTANQTATAASPQVSTTICQTTHARHTSQTKVKHILEEKVTWEERATNDKTRDDDNDAEIAYSIPPLLDNNMEEKQPRSNNKRPRSDAATAANAPKPKCGVVSNIMHPTTSGTILEELPSTNPFVDDALGRILAKEWKALAAISEKKKRVSKKKKKQHKGNKAKSSQLVYI